VAVHHCFGNVFVKLSLLLLKLHREARYLFLIWSLDTAYFSITLLVNYQLSAVFWVQLIFLCVYDRCKYHRLKYGTELEQGDMIPPKFEKELRGMLHLLSYLAFLC